MLRPEIAYPSAASFHLAREPLILLGYFAPTLLMILRRPNGGSEPAWLERAVERAPWWLREKPASKVA